MHATSTSLALWRRQQRLLCRVSNPIAVLLVLVASPTSAQSSTWIHQLGTSAYDYANAAIPDGSGGVFLCGSTEGSLAGPPSGSSDVWLARVDPTGNQLWGLQFGTVGNDSATAMTSDGSGGFFVAGHTSSNLGGTSLGALDAWLARFNSNGDQLWIHQFGSDKWDELYAASSDGLGGVYVAGLTFGSVDGPSVGKSDVWVARFDAAGSQAWVRQFGSSEMDETRAAAPDSSGGVFIAGYTYGDLAGTNANHSFRDAWFARLDPSGTVLWIKQLGGDQDDIAFAACHDGSGGVYVAGSTAGSLGGPNLGQRDAWLARYGSSGTQLWIRQFGTVDDEGVGGAAPDLLGGVYVAGGTTGALGGPYNGNNDAWLAGFDSSGGLSWSHQVGGIAYDSSSWVVPGNGGAVYWGGSTSSSLGGPSAGLVDIWVAFHDSCVGSKYCVGAINSTGQSASIGHKGSTSIKQNSLELTVHGCPPGQFGIFFLGLYKAQAPFGDGWLCVTGGQKRLLPAVVLDAVGAGSLSLDFTDPGSAASTITVGSVRHFQFWYRDPQLVGNQFNLSDGLSAYFCP